MLFVHLKTDNLDYLQKPSWNFFLHLFAIPSLSRHEKRCPILERIFRLFQCSINNSVFQPGGAYFAHQIIGGKPIFFTFLLHYKFLLFSAYRIYANSFRSPPLVETMTTKVHFKINWPLVRKVFFIATTIWNFLYFTDSNEYFPRKLFAEIL